MTPDEYCKEKAAASGSSFYVSFLFLPPAQRRAIIALYAFCREVDDAVDDSRDPGVARLKLDWWRGEIARTFAGSPSHPVGKALAAVLETRDLPQEQFQEIIDGMQMDLEQTRYASFKDLGLYCYRAAGVVGQLTAEVFGYEDRRTLKYANDLGFAFQLTNILRDVREDAARGRIYIPADEMDRFGVKAGHLFDGIRSDATTALFRFQAERARAYFRRAFEHLPQQDRYRQRGGIIMAAIYRATLEAIEDQDFPVLERRVSLPAWRKLWLAWRTARREARFRPRSPLPTE